MTKIAKNPKNRSAESEHTDDKADPTTAPEIKSLFKPRPEDDDFDPLDLANSAEDLEAFEQIELRAFAAQGYGEAPQALHWEHTEGLSRDDLDRRDRAEEAVLFGRPRTVRLSIGPYTVMRLAPPLAADSMADKVPGRGTEERRDRLQLRSDATTNHIRLEGPATEHAVDELVSALFTRSPMFAPALQALRDSAHASLARGANFLHFRPLLIVSGPGMGKTTLAQLLAELSRLPLIYLDGATMTTATDLTGADSVFRSARPSAIAQGILEHGVGNPIVVFDEVDKLADMSNSARPYPAEALLPFLEPGTAGRVHEHFLQLDLDLRHLNWLLLANDLDKVPRTVRDGCKVIQLPPLRPQDLSATAEAEVRRRHLEPELVATLTQACACGQISSLRKLHRALDAAQATMRRPQLH